MRPPDSLNGRSARSTPALNTQHHEVRERERKISKQPRLVAFGHVGMPPPCALRTPYSSLTALCSWTSRRPSLSRYCRTPAGRAWSPPFRGRLEALACKSADDRRIRSKNFRALLGGRHRHTRRTHGHRGGRTEPRCRLAFPTRPDPASGTGRRSTPPVASSSFWTAPLISRLYANWTTPKDASRRRTTRLVNVGVNQLDTQLPGALWPAYCERGMVEAGGIEPPSQDEPVRASTRVVLVLDLVPANARDRLSQGPASEVSPGGSTRGDTPASPPYGDPSLPAGRAEGSRR